tara:strand:+ start:647 stop:1060 length:414 start_codon:yes stop_codon:yes gene_type:complete
MLSPVKAAATHLSGSSLPNHEPKIQQGHPCKFAGRALENITNFFKYKWDAKYRDLKEEDVQIWVKHHSLEEMNVTFVRVFASHMQRKLAIVSATESPLFNGQKFPSLYCIVPIQSQLVKTYTKEELAEILGQKERDV